jgi:hypothetical protein
MKKTMKIHVREKGDWLEWKLAEDCRFSGMAVSGGVYIRHVHYETAMSSLTRSLKRDYQGHKLEIIADK